jgi:hypothetical protein
MGVKCDLAANAEGGYDVLFTWKEAVNMAEKNGKSE